MAGLFDGYEQLPGIFAPPRVALPPPVAPGMQGAVTLPPRPAPAPGFGSRLLSGLQTAIGGENDPALSEEENRKARNAALLRAGLSMLANSGPSRQPVGFGRILAGGIAAGQEAGAASRATSQAEEQKQKLAQIIQSGAGPDQLLAMYQQQILDGDTEGARATATVLQSALAAQSKGQGNLQRFQGPDGKLYTFDPTTGEAKPIAGPNGEPMSAPTDLESKDLGDRIVWYPTGHPERIVHIQRKGRLPGSGGAGFDPETDPVIQRKLYEAEHGMVPEKNLTQGQSTIAAVLPSAEMGMKAAEEVIAKLGGTVPIGTKLGDIPILGNYLLNEDFQKLRTAMNQAGLAVARMQGGQNLTEAEVRNNAKQFVPAPGDTPATVQQKLNALRANIEGLRNALPSRLTEDKPKPAADWRARAAALKAAGQSPDQIVATLRGEGLIQ